LLRRRIEEAHDTCPILAPHPFRKGEWAVYLFFLVMAFAEPESYNDA